jgi:hypothetical protein
MGERAAAGAAIVARRRGSALTAQASRSHLASLDGADRALPRRDLWELPARPSICYKC